MGEGNSTITTTTTSATTDRLSAPFPSTREAAGALTVIWMVASGRHNEAIVALESARVGIVGGKALLGKPDRKLEKDLQLEKESRD